MIYSSGINADERVATDGGILTPNSIFENQTDCILDSSDNITNLLRVSPLYNKPIFKLITKEGYSISGSDSLEIVTQRGWSNYQMFYQVIRYF